MSSRTVKSSARAKFSARMVFAGALSLSFAVHLTLTPVMTFFGALSWLAMPASVQPGTSEPLRTIEIDIGWLESQPAPTNNSESAPTGFTQAQLNSNPPAVSKSSEKVVVDKKKSTQTKTSRKRPARKPSRKSKPKVRESKPDSSIAHPVASSGLSSKAIDDNATVNLLIAMEPIRAHVLGKRIGRLLVNLPQWRSFLGAASVDPVQDFERILLVGPEMSRSSDVVVVVQHLLSPTKMHAAIDTIVQRPPRGQWLATKPLAALARADRAKRLFVLSAPSVLVIAPPSLQRQLLSTPITGFPSPSGGIAALVHIKEPRKALARFSVGLPVSLKWIRIAVTPNNTGGASLNFEAEDSNKAMARRHAPELSAAINAVTNPDLGALGALIGLKTIAFLDPLNLTARGQNISGRVDISRRQLSRLLAYVEGWVGSRTQRISRPLTGKPPSLKKKKLP